MSLTVLYLTFAEVAAIQTRQIERFGGRPGILNRNLVESALFRPQQVAFDVEPYPTINEKSSALLEGLARNHGFNDGNKRVALVATAMFLRLNGWRLTFSVDEGESFMLRVAGGSVEFDEICAWIGTHATPGVPAGGSP